MSIAFAAMLLLQSPMVNSMAADEGFRSCVKMATDDALLRDVKPDAFRSHLERICGPARNQWMKARDEADGEDADPEGTFYAAKSRFDAAIADYAKRYAGK